MDDILAKAGGLDFSRAPFLVIWETTQACDLACKHCRAEARPERDPRELTTEEAKRLMDDVRRFGPLVFVFSGGDALKRPDIVSGDPRRVSAGRRLVRVGAEDPSHLAGTRTLDPGEHGHRPSQPGRLRCPGRPHGEARHRLLGSLLSRPHGTGPRGRHAQRRRVRGGVPPHVRAVEDGTVRHEGDGRSAVRAGGAPAGGGRATGGRARGVTEGHGFLFVSHTGEIYPSGFLPVSAGNVRTDDVVEVYRESRLFRELRDLSLLRGKCGVCEFRGVCGGCRARAFAMTGSYLESDPFCAHIPRAYEAAAPGRSDAPTLSSAP